MLLSLCKVLHSSFLIGWFSITRFPANGKDHSVTFFLEYVTIVEGGLGEHAPWSIISKCDIPAVGFVDTRRFVKMIIQDTGDTFVWVSGDIAIEIICISSGSRLKPKQSIRYRGCVGDTGYSVAGLSTVVVCQLVYQYCSTACRWACYTISGQSRKRKSHTTL